jgi:hypothetical protein
MPTTETLEARLVEVENAIHELNMGDKEVEIEYEGSRVKFSPTNLQKLQRYKNSLMRQLGQPVAPGSRRVTF